MILWKSTWRADSPPIQTATPAGRTHSRRGPVVCWAASAPHGREAALFRLITSYRLTGGMYRQKEKQQRNHCAAAKSGPRGIRTLDLSDANRTLSQLSYRPIETVRYCLDSVPLNSKCIIPFCSIGCQDVSFLLWSNCGQTTPTNDFSPPAKLHRAISIFINRSCAFCLHELSIRRICQPMPKLCTASCLTA